MTDDETIDAEAEAFVKRYDAGAKRLIRAVQRGGATGERIDQLLMSLMDGTPGPDMGRLIANADEENMAAILAVIEGQAMIGVHPLLDQWRVGRAVRQNEGPDEGSNEGPERQEMRL